MGNYESKKRTRPCVSCKRQKLKCQYKESLPCERCVKHGITCYFPSNQKTLVPTTYDKEPEPGVRRKLPHPLPPVQFPKVQNRLEPLPKIQEQNVSSDLLSRLPTAYPETDGTSWPNSVEERLEVLQNALQSMLTIFHHNQIQHEQQVNLLQAQLSRQRDIIEHLPPQTNTSPVSLPSLSEIITSDRDRDQDQVTDFRKYGIISRTEAADLLQIFRTKMSAHMFGYDFGKLNINELWDRSPLLLSAICTVACPHHEVLCSKKEKLRSSLRWFSLNLINHCDAMKDGLSVEHSILGLVIASLWLESNQLYMSIALQLARLWRLDQYQEEGEGKELWKLWYLLYIADGTQNLISKKSPSIYKQTEPLIASVRDSLVAHIDDPALKKVLQENTITGEVLTNKQLLLLNEADHEKIHVNSYTLRNMHLCGLVEYHMAIESLFHGNVNNSLEAASGLLKPKHFGVPWENNMDLDKWMISWTITLQNIDFQNDPWSLKSTLLYYNFARMHINTQWLSERRASFESSEWLKVWNSATSPSSKSMLADASHDISFSAATSLLKLGTKDKDVSSLFEYLPNHIYLMLFYACIIVLETPPSFEPTDFSTLKKLRQSFKLVKEFRNMLVSRSSTDSDFTTRIIKSLDSLMGAFIEKCIKVTTNSRAIDQRIEEIIQDPEDNLSSEQPRKSISAWPSINHGHP